MIFPRSHPTARCRDRFARNLLTLPAGSYASRRDIYLQKVLASVDEGGAQSTGFLGFLLLKQPFLHKPLCEAQRHVRYRI